MKDTIINKKEGIAKISLDTNFYNYEAILQASKDFSENFWVYMDGDVCDKILVSIKSKSGVEADLDTLGYEFYNYVLGLMQNEL